MFKYARYQGEVDVEALAMRVYRLPDREGDRTRLAVKRLFEANPQLEKMRSLPQGAPLVVPLLDGEVRGRDDHFEEARDLLASLSAALTKAVKNAEAEAQKRNEILQQPEVRRALEEARLSERADAARSDAEAHVKTMQALEERTKKSVEKLRARIDALAERPPR